jgi:hypothetical protein
MHDRDPTEQFRAPAREPKPGTFHRPAHGFGMKRVREAAELRLRGPMTGEQKLGEGLRELPLVGNAGAAARRANPRAGPDSLADSDSIDIVAAGCGAPSDFKSYELIRRLRKQQLNFNALGFVHN